MIRTNPQTNARTAKNPSEQLATVSTPVVSSDYDALNFLAVLTLVNDVVDDLVCNVRVPVGYVADDLDH